MNKELFVNNDEELHSSSEIPKEERKPGRVGKRPFVCPPFTTIGRRVWWATINLLPTLPGYFDFCKRTFSKNVALLHDYGLYEFTILVKKQL